ncbi:MAG: hypothetical protein IPK22_13515 [Verrucomicrobiaceae bacterium]|nr:hypothetical protein [Verrucomicrobiaceae bacterium]
MSAAPFIHRVSYQLRTDARHQALVIILWLAWLAARLWQRHSGILGSHDELLSSYVELITACIAIGITHRCIHADAPASPETAALTRPVGRGALLLGKSLFLLVTVLLPFVVAESVLWRGFGHDLRQLAALAAGSFLTGGIVLALAAAISAISRTRGQALGLGFATLMLINAATFIVNSLEDHAWPWLNSIFEHSLFLHTNGGIIAAVIALLLCLTALWVSFVTRRRLPAAMLVLLAFVQEPVTTSLRQHDWFRGLDWLEQTPRRYDAPLTLHTGKEMGDEKAAAQEFWPGLRLSGLRGDEAATIIAFAPVDKKLPPHFWPQPPFYSDIVRGFPNGNVWAHYDHARVVMRRTAPATLWLLGNLKHSPNDLRWLEDDLKPFQINLAQPQKQKWRLRLAIHGVKQIAQLPFRQLWDHPHTFLIEPGTRLECDPVTSWSSHKHSLRGRIHRSRSTLIAKSPYEVSASASGLPMPLAIMLVLSDSKLKEASVHDLFHSTAARPLDVPSYDHDLAWQLDTATGFSAQIDEPPLQQVVLGKDREDWIARQTAIFYTLEDRGTVDLELTPGQMDQLLAGIKPKEAAKP